MKRGIAILIITFCFSSLFAQLNMLFLDSLKYQFHNSLLSDVWGYADSNGKEYAIVGLEVGGVSIVDVSNPSDIKEVFFEPGPQTGWRDIKTWNKHAYITNENSGGLQIIDLNNLPDSNLAVSYYTSGGWHTAHNLYIDENGVCYIFGADRGKGGVIMLDLTQDPKAPVEIGVYDPYYAHDGMARGDTLYVAHINDGFCSVMGVSDKAHPVVLGTFPTSGNKSHNIWVSDHGNFVFTTDEISNGFLGAYDISDLNNVKEVDLIQSSPGENVIPHNTHFINNYLVTSYYNDGVTIHDVSDPANMIEVGHFDTSPFSGTGFTGAWGAYPWLPSGNILVSDVTEGLFVLSADYKRGCSLKGIIRDAINSAVLNNVTVTIISTGESGVSGLNGNYATGTAVSGNYSIAFNKPGYRKDTVSGISLSNGTVTTLNHDLVPILPFAFSGVVTEAGGNKGIPFSQVRMVSKDYLYETTADSNGNFSLPAVFESDYEVFAGKWGYRTNCLSEQHFSSSSHTVHLYLEPGYYDDFTFDFGWTVSGSASAVKGKWERGAPYGTLYGPVEVNPDLDIPNDCGDQAYITGNNGNIYNEVDGFTILTSPIFDATQFADWYVNYYRWFFNYGQDAKPGNDSMTVTLSNGDTTVIIEMVLGATSSFLVHWTLVSRKISHYITPTATMQLIFRIADQVNHGDHYTEGGVDVFQLSQYPVSVQETATHEASLSVYPNPSDDYLYIVYPSGNESLTVEIFDLLGKRIFFKSEGFENGRFKVEHDFPKGSYIVKVTTGKGKFQTAKFIRL